MCKFFSCISDGEGRVLWFTPEIAVELIKNGDKEHYEFNSHTSIAHYYGVNEDQYNKWEYDVEREAMVEDQINTKNDRVLVEQTVKEYLATQNIVVMRNVFNRNTGNMNSGKRNTGNCNSGNDNSGNTNSSDRNSGNWNSGSRNSGNWNSGYRNSGNSNSGSMNSGNRNSGDMNSGNGYINSFCTTHRYFLFDAECTKEDHDKLDAVDRSWFRLTEWISASSMTDEEKRTAPGFYRRDGYLKKYSYKEAWSKCPEHVLERIKALKNFDAKKFEEITGIRV